MKCFAALRVLEKIRMRTAWQERAWSKGAQQRLGLWSLWVGEKSSSSSCIVLFSKLKDSVLIVHQNALLIYMIFLKRKEKWSTTFFILLNNPKIIGNINYTIMHFLVLFTTEIHYLQTINKTLVFSNVKNKFLTILFLLNLQRFGFIFYGEFINSCFMIILNSPRSIRSKST